jgi:hypothetical protein
MSDHGPTPAAAATAEAIGYRYGVALRRVLKNFHGAVGIELRFDRQGHLTGVGLGPRTRRPAATCEVGNDEFCSEACECPCHDRPLTGPDRSGRDG